MSNRIELGVEVKDKVTGFKGIASGRSEYLSGCTHICIQPKVEKDKKLPEAKWFDEPMVEVIIKGKKIKQVKTKKGGPLLTSPSR